MKHKLIEIAKLLVIILTWPILLLFMLGHDWNADRKNRRIRTRK